MLTTAFPSLPYADRSVLQLIVFEQDRSLAVHFTHLSQPKPKRFDPSGKHKLQIRIDRIGSFDDGCYEIATGSYATVADAIEGGHSVTINGMADHYWQNDRRVDAENMRIYVKVNSSSNRLTMEREIIGGGAFEDGNYVEIELNVEPRIVRDVLLVTR
jgi:hypothetical protein